MKERAITLLLALGALLAFYALFMPKPQSGQQIALPLSTEGRDAGYQGAWRWLRSQGIRVISLRSRYDALDRVAPSPTGNLLVSTLPHAVPARAGESEQLRSWLQRGNTLLVMAALNDTPPWALDAAPQDFLNTLARMSGMRFDKVPESGSARVGTSIRETLQLLVEPQREMLFPTGPHGLTDGVGSVATQSEYPASRWVAVRQATTMTLELARLADDRPAMWLLREGQGQILVLAHASPFSNAVIGQQDNARLLANIVARSLVPGGVVLFDDAHQGLADYYDARAFFADARLHRTLLWLGVLWLLFVLGWQRLRPQADRWQPADVTRFIEVTGDFLAARVPPQQASQRLFANFFNAIRRRIGLAEDGEPVWEWLAAQASVPQPDLQKLQQLHADTLAGHRIDLVTLQNRLTDLAGKLT